MKISRFRRRAFFCIALCVLVTAGCAAKEPAKTFTPPAGDLAGSWVFRHAATLEFPGADLVLPFAGVMRLDGHARQVHAVALSGMGMTLLDMRVDAAGYTLRFIHPSLAKFPDAAENAAAVIRFLWLGRTLPDAMAVNGATVLADGFLNGWAAKITLQGDRFVLRVTLVESRREVESLP